MTDQPSPVTWVSDVDDEFAAWLAAEREKSAAEWEPPCPPDWEADAASGARGATPALERFLSSQHCAAELLREWEHAAEQLARWQSVQLRVLAEAHDMSVAGDAVSTSGLPLRSMAAELACAVGMSDRTIEQHMNDAAVLRDRFAATLRALQDGRFSRAHAQVVADEGFRLADDEVRARYEELVLDLAPHLTTGRLRAAAKAIAETLNPVSIAERHDLARARRHVSLRDVDDGMSELWTLQPSVLAHAMHDYLTQLARAGSDPVADDPADEASDAPVPADERTMDQRRADILADLVLTGLPTTAAIDAHGGAGIDAIRAIVQITVPAATLAGDDSATPTLAGGCPIDPDSARHLVASATLWNRLLTDPFSGEILAVDRRFPTESQRRFLRARDEHCRFPGCRMPVWRCDVDHTVDHQHGGETAPCNLSHLCRRHHVLKHQTGWKVEQLPGGVLVWTSPLGRVYTDRPPSTLRFVPTGPDPGPPAEPAPSG